MHSKTGRWVELIYALYTVKRINNGKIFLKEFFQQMGEIFDFDVKEFANYFMNIKNRTDSHRTKFLDLLKDTVLGRMDYKQMILYLITKKGFATREDIVNLRHYCILLSRKNSIFAK